MEKLDNILVCLDLTEMDDFLIRYANYLVEKTEPKKVWFLHIIQPFDLPHEVLSEFPDLDQPVSKFIREEMKERVDELFEHKQSRQYEIEVLEGIKLDSLLEFTRDQKIKLTVMGKKVGFEGTGAFPRRIRPLTTSSVIMVSETAKPQINNILVRMDFSKMSELAMKSAIELSRKTGSGIFAVNAFRLPISHFPKYSNEDARRLQAKMVRHGEKEYEKFMRKIKQDPAAIPCVHVYDKEFDEARVLYHQGLTRQADLIMIGSRVKSDLASFFRFLFPVPRRFCVAY